MLDLKSYEDFALGEDQTEYNSLDKIRNYTDYVRKGLYQDGSLDDEQEADIQAGVIDRIKQDGLITDQMSEEEATNVVSSVLTPKSNTDADARFVLDHLNTTADPNQPNENQATLNRYLVAKRQNPEMASTMQDSVNTILSDKSLVRSARIAAVNRGDVPVVTFEDEAGKRRLHAQSGLDPAIVKGSVDSLISNGAISSSDLRGVNNLTKPVIEGVSTQGDVARFAHFSSTMDDSIRKNTDLMGSLNTSVDTFRKDTEEKQRTFGESVYKNVTGGIASVFDTVAGITTDVLGATGVMNMPKQEKVYDDLLTTLRNDPAFANEYKDSELQSFAKSYVMHKAKPVYDAEKPQTGVAIDELGMPVIADAILARKDKFDLAVNAAGLSEKQRELANTQRELELAQKAPELLNVITKADPKAASAFAQAKAKGQSDTDFLQEWTMDDANYSKMSNRFNSFKDSISSAVVDLPLSVAALAGSEGAVKTMADMKKTQGYKAEYARMFGDEFGIGMDALSALPAVGVDILAAIGTGGAASLTKRALTGTARSTATKLTEKTAIRSATTTVMEGLEADAAATVRAAAVAGGEGLVSEAFDKAGKSVSNQLYGQMTDLAPMTAIAFTRSAGSAFTSIYGQLPETMSHEEKYKASIGSALGAGLSTAIITAGMSFLGRGGIEDAATGKIRPMTTLEGELSEAAKMAGKEMDTVAGSRAISVSDLTYKQAKALYSEVFNEGQIVKNAAFNKALRAATSGAYKNFLKKTATGFIDEFTEESLDQAFQSRIEDAALNRNTPVVERLNQIWSAGVTGGLIGGGGKAFGQIVMPLSASARTEALQARASVYDNIATRLSTSGSPMMGEAVQKMVADARTALEDSRKKDLAAASASEITKKTELLPDVADKRIRVREGQVIGNEDAMLVDMIGERAHAYGHEGTLALDPESDAVHLRFDKPLATGETHFNLGAKYQKAPNVVSKREHLYGLGQATDTFAAGTPFLTRGPNKFALPEAADMTAHLDEEGNIVGVSVNGARMVSQPTVTMPLFIRDVNLARDIASFYGTRLDALPTIQPEVEAPVVAEAETPEIASDTIAPPERQPSIEDLTPLKQEANLSEVDNAAIDEFNSTMSAYGSFEPLMYENPTSTKFQKAVAGLGMSDLDAIISELDAEHYRISRNNMVSDKTKSELLGHIENLTYRANNALNLSSGYGFEIFTDDEPFSPRAGDVVGEPDYDFLREEDVFGAAPKRPVTEAAPVVAAEAAPVVAAEEPKKPAGRKGRNKKPAAEAAPVVAAEAAPTAEVEPVVYTAAENRDAILAILSENPKALEEWYVLIDGETRHPRFAQKDGTFTYFVGKEERRGSIDDIDAISLAQLRKSLAPVEATAAEAAPVVAAEEPKKPAGRKGRTKKPAAAAAEAAPTAEVEPIAEAAPAVEVPSPRAVADAQDPVKRRARLNKVRDNLPETIVVADTNGDATRFNNLKSQLDRVNASIETLQSKDPNAVIPALILKKQASLVRTMAAAQKELDAKTKIVDDQIDNLDKPEVDEPSEDEVHAQELADAIEGITKPTPTKAPKAPKEPKTPKGVAVTPIETAYGAFRNDTEATSFADMVAGGYLVSDPQRYANFGHTGTGVQNYTLDIKERLYNEVQKAFPFIPIPKKGIGSVTAKKSLRPMVAGMLEWHKAPTITDKNGKNIAGFFTNNPLDIRVQIDNGLDVFVPQKLLNSKKFKLNPSIQVNKSGQVKRVDRHPNDGIGVVSKGDDSRAVNTYAPKGSDTYFLLDNLLREPAPANLELAGKDANGEFRSERYNSYINAAYNATQDGSKHYKRLTSDGKRFVVEAQDTFLNSIRAYSVSLKEFGLASKILSEVESLQSTDSKASIGTYSDAELSDMLLREMKDKGRTPDIDDAASVIGRVHKFLEGATSEGTLGNYGRYLYNERTRGRMVGGAISLDYHIKIFEGLTKAAFDNIRRSSGRNNFSLNDPAYQAVADSLIDPSYDMSYESVFDSQKSVLNQLTRTLDEDPEAYRLLHHIVRYAMGVDSLEDLSPKDLISTASTALDNKNDERNTLIYKGLSNSRQGLLLAKQLIEAGWLYEPETQRVITPNATRLSGPTAKRIGSEPKPLVDVATAFGGQTVNVKPVRTKKPPTVAQLRNLRTAAKNQGSKFYAKGDYNIAVEAARRVNTKEVAALGLESNNPSSIVDALDKIVKTGQPMQQIVAKLLLQFPDIVRNTGFVIGDLNSSHYAGSYLSDSNIVILNLSGHNGRGLTDVILHEYLHAVTQQVISNPQTLEQQAAVQRISDLRRLVAETASRKGIDTSNFADALTSNEEFLAYGLTAPDFQAVMKSSTPVEQRSLLSRFVDAILGFFGIKTSDKNIADPIEDLIDFAKMSGTNNTFNIDANRNANLSRESIARALDRLRDDALARRNIQNIINSVESEDMPVVELSAATEVSRALPSGYTAVANADLKGVMGISRDNPTEVQFHPALIKGVVAGLSDANAKATIKTMVNHELAHAEADSKFTVSDYQRQADLMGKDMLDVMADLYYSLTEPNYEARQAMLAADRESGNLPDWKIAAEFIRSQIEEAAYGRTSEQQLAFLRSDPKVFSKFVEAVKAFINKLRISFKDNPTLGTAASISHMARNLRRIENGSLLPASPKVNTESGHVAEYLEALTEGSDQTLYAMPISNLANPKSTDSIWERIKKLFVNLPPDIRAHVDERNGLLNRISHNVEKFHAQYKPLAKAAVSAGVAIDDIRSSLGSTAPTMDEAALNRVQAQLDAFVRSYPPNADPIKAEEEFANKRNELYLQEKTVQDTLFRQEQDRAVQRIRDAGFTQFANLLTKFREEMNNFNVAIGYGDSADIYLTRTYKLFTTKGWTLAAKEGGTYEVDGVDIDFDALRATAAKAFEKDVLKDARVKGISLSNEELNTQMFKKLDDFLSHLEQQSTTTNPATLDTLRKDLKRFMPKSNIDAGLRALMGEVTDPLENAIRTFSNVGYLAANDKFLTGLRTTLLESKIAQTTPASGLVPLFGKSGNPALSPLAGLHVPADVAKAIQAEFGTNGRTLKSNTDESMSFVMRWLSKMTGAAVAAKTTLSLGFYSRNFFSNQVALLAAQGILPVNRHTLDAYRASLYANFTSKAGGPEIQALTDRLIDLQIVKDSSTRQVTMDLLKGFSEDSVERLENIINALSNPKASSLEELVSAFTGKSPIESGIIVKDFLAGKGSWMIGFLNACNGLIDDAAKVQVYMHELDTLEKAYGDTWTTEEKENEAARITKRVMPTHSQQWDLMRSYGKTPLASILLPFGRWKTEVVRTMANTLRQGTNELRSGNPTLALRGARRLGSFGAVTTVGGKFAGMAFATLFGALKGDDEDDKENRALTEVEELDIREGLQKWQRGHELYTRLHNGSIDVIDMTSIMPYSEVTDLWGITSQSLRKGEGVPAKDLAKYIGTQIIGTQILAGAVLNVASNQDAFNRPIYLESDNLADATQKSLGHIFKQAFMPAIIAKAMKATRKGEKEGMSMLLGEIIGTRQTEPKVSDIAMSAAWNIKKSLEDAHMMRGRISSSRLLPQDELEEAVIKSQDYSNKAQARLYRLSKTLDSLGVSPAQQFAIMEDVKISKLRYAQARAGINVRHTGNGEWAAGVADSVKRGKEEDPMTRLRNYYAITSKMPAYYDITGSR